MKRYCYWSVADGDYATMFKSTLKSARRVGVVEDFHIWTDESIAGAVTHASGAFDKWGCLFKLTFLRNAVRKLEYEYFVWIDTDTYFVRNPGDLLRLMHGSPLHISLECDLLSPDNHRPDWWRCPSPKFVELMRKAGVRSRRVYNVNGGLFIVHRDAVETLFNLAMEFYDQCLNQGFRFVDEPLLAYAMQMLCADTAAHTLEATQDVWASDWTGEFRDRLPTGAAWWTTDYFTRTRKLINPAIVHAMRSKSALVADGRSPGN